MVIDGAKGVEDRTIKLMNVCRLRDTPILSFVNKMDRDIRDPVERVSFGHPGGLDAGGEFNEIHVSRRTTPNPRRVKVAKDADHQGASPPRRKTCSPMPS